MAYGLIGRCHWPFRAASRCNTGSGVLCTSVALWDPGAPSAKDLQTGAAHRALGCVRAGVQSRLRAAVCLRSGYQAKALYSTAGGRGHAPDRPGISTAHSHSPHTHTHTHTQTPHTSHRTAPHYRLVSLTHRALAGLARRSSPRPGPIPACFHRFGCREQPSAVSTTPSSTSTCTCNEIAPLIATLVQPWRPSAATWTHVECF